MFETYFKLIINHQFAWSNGKKYNDMLPSIFFHPFSGSIPENFQGALFHIFTGKMDQ